MPDKTDVNDGDAKIILLPSAWRGVGARAAELGRQLMAHASDSEACQIVMPVPGVGYYRNVVHGSIEGPANFRMSLSEAAWLGLTPR